MCIRDRFYVGLLGMIIIVCVLIVVGIIGHTYYNVLVPIRQLQVAAIHISEGAVSYTHLDVYKRQPHNLS